MSTLGLASARTPRALIMNFFAAHIVDSPYMPQTVSARALIEICAGVGIAEHATRSTLKRMVSRGTLVRSQKGRTAHYAVSPAAADVLRDGRARVAASLLPPVDNGSEWTLITLWLPDHEERHRQRIRTRLSWSGFGALQPGVWIAPRRISSEEVAALADPGAIRAFEARPFDAEELVTQAAEIWDLSDIAAAYDEFIARYSRPSSDMDALSEELLLTADWLAIIARDPGLPPFFVPANWPAPRAISIFADRIDALADDAKRRAEEVVPRRFT